MAAGAGRGASARASQREARRLDWRLAVGDVLGSGERLEVAARLVLPAQDDPAALLVCLPGGFLSRRYWDLELDGDRRYSFAEHVARAGLATLALDPLGAGDSARPRDGWQLDAEPLAHASQAALGAARERWLRELREPLPVTIGVGHSMGSCLSVVQQALHRPHAALVLFSFTTAGLPEYLEAGERAVAGDARAIGAALPRLARERFGVPYPETGATGAEGAAFQVGSAPPAAARALDRARTNVLPLPGLRSMIPGGYAPWAGAIDVPVFVASGDHDLATGRAAPAELPKAPEVVVFELDDCWHCHHVAKGRARLWSRVARWVQGVAAAPQTS